MIALVVDRDWDSRESLKNKLSHRGFEVLLAENAEEALNLCIIHDVSWVISAAELPEMSGFRLVERIREGRGDLSVEAVLLLDRDQDLSESLSELSGVRTVVRKPITEESLDQCLEPAP